MTLSGTFAVITNFIIKPNKIQLYKAVRVKYIVSEGIVLYETSIYINNA